MTLRLSILVLLATTTLMAGCRDPQPPPTDREAAPVVAASPHDPAAPGATTVPSAAGTPGGVSGSPEAPVPFKITGVQMARSVDSTGKAVSPVTTFTPQDTIYVSIASDGVAQKVGLSVRWSYQTGEVFGNESKTIDANGPRFTEFHISKTSAWPAGFYKVDVMHNADPVQTVEFEVSGAGTGPAAPPAG